MIVKTARGTVIATTDLFNPKIGERTGPAWDRILDILSDREWHSWREIVSVIEPNSGLQSKTISNMLHGGLSAGYCERSGKYSKDPDKDSRSIRLLREYSPPVIIP